jgi:uncharacterized protein
LKEVGFMTVDEIIQAYDLRPHPEGGYYRESYRSSGSFLKTDQGPSRSFSTCIYYLLVPGARSKFHRLTSDEIFHFYLGDPVSWILLSESGGMELKVLGASAHQGQTVQLMIPAGTWFGGFLNEGGKYALMGTTVSPGFEFEDFELASAEKLLTQFPKFRDWILRLT